MIGVGIGLPFYRSFGSGVDAQAQVHFNRVIADGGVVPSGLSGVNAFFSAIKAIYGTSDINTAISAAYDAHYLGYKLGAGSGTTLGQAAQKLYSCSGASGDVVQTTAASQPLLLEHSGDNYWFGSGVSGDYVSTPQSAANQITGDVDVKAYINPSSTKDLKGIVGSGTGAQPNLRLELMSNRTLRFWKFGNFGTVAISNALTNVNQWIRVTHNTSTNQVIYYTSNDAPTTNINSINWTQLGSAISYATTPSLVNSELWIGNYPGFPNDLQYQNGIYRVTISNSIGGTPVVDFNPASYNPATSQTQWTSATGEVWSISTGTAATGYKGAVITKSIVMSDGIDDIISKNTAFTSSKNLSFYSAKRSYNITDNDGYLTSGLNPQEMTLSDNNIYVGGVSYNPTGRSTILQFAALRQSSANVSKVRYNENADTSGTPTTISVNRVILFGSPYAWDFGTAQFSNNILSTILVSSAYDSDATTTAVYNTIKGFNNNSF